MFNGVELLSNSPPPVRPTSALHVIATIDASSCRPSIAQKEHPTLCSGILRPVDRDAAGAQLRDPHGSPCSEARRVPKLIGSSSELLERTSSGRTENPARMPERPGTPTIARHLQSVGNAKRHKARRKTAIAAPTINRAKGTPNPLSSSGIFAPVAFPRRLGRRSRQLLTTRVIERRLPGRPLVRG